MCYITRHRAIEKCRIAAQTHARSALNWQPCDLDLWPLTFELQRQFLLQGVCIIPIVFYFQTWLVYKLGIVSHSHCMNLLSPKTCNRQLKLFCFYMFNKFGANCSNHLPVRTQAPICRHTESITDTTDHPNPCVANRRCECNFQRSFKQREFNGSTVGPYVALN